MKALILTLFVGLFAVIGTTNATNPIADDITSNDIVEAEYEYTTADNGGIFGKIFKKGGFFTKVKNWVATKVFKSEALGGLSDPVDKWFWFWILGWGAAIVLTIIASAVVVGSAFSGGFGVGGILYLVAWLAGLFGSISFVVWLVKKFA